VGWISHIFSGIVNMEKLKNIKQKIAETTKQNIHGATNTQRNDGLLAHLTKPRIAEISSDSAIPDLICLSHLRWDFVYQRPQHLLSRIAKERRVFFVEEPIFEDTLPRLDISKRDGGIWVVVPHLPDGMTESEAITTQQALLLDDLILQYELSNYILWYYTPMARGFTRHLEPMAVIYDCMDELSAFKNPPPRLKEYEAELLRCADLVFTGGYSLYEAKKHLHSNIHPFPSSIDGAHFRQARAKLDEPADQANIPYPRLGFFGVIDERLDIELLGQIAEARPDWQLVIVGPIVKIDPADLPKKSNIHYLGAKSYQELPAYLSGWDVALLPFAHNDSTRFISPTKTPEYLAGGVPVVSTSIRDVVRPYGQQDLVKIADTPADFVAAIEVLLSEEFERSTWLKRVDESLAFNSWDRTWGRMMKLLHEVLQSRYAPSMNKEIRLLTAKDMSAKPQSVSQVAGD
jgi:UDP-galactopyranose mutase